MGLIFTFVVVFLLHLFSIFGEGLTEFIDFRCKASAVAVSVCISLMLQRLPSIMKTDGQYDVKKLIKETYEYAKKQLETEDDVSWISFI